MCMKIKFLFAVAVFSVTSFFSASADDETYAEKVEKNCIVKNNSYYCSDAGLLYIEGKIVKADDHSASELFYHGCELDDVFSCTVLKFSPEKEQKEGMSIIKTNSGSSVRFVPFSTFSTYSRACLLSQSRDGAILHAFKVKGILFNSKDLSVYHENRKVTDSSSYYIAKFPDSTTVILHFDKKGGGIPKKLTQAMDLKDRKWLIKKSWKNCEENYMKQ